MKAITVEPQKGGYTDGGCAGAICSLRRSARERYLVVVNLSGARSQAIVKVPWEELKA